MNTTIERTAAEISAQIGELRTKRSEIQRHLRTAREDAESLRIASGTAVIDNNEAGRADLRRQTLENTADIEANGEALVQLGVQIGELEGELQVAQRIEHDQAHGVARATLEEATQAYNDELRAALGRLKPLADAMCAAGRAEAKFHDGGAKDHDRPLLSRQMFHVASTLEGLQRGGVLPRN